MSRNKFNVNNRSARVFVANNFGATQQDAGTPKTLTTYLGLRYNIRESATRSVETRKGG
jgi:hypothetical protein